MGVVQDFLVVLRYYAAHAGAGAVADFDRVSVEEPRKFVVGWEVLVKE